MSKVVQIRKMLEACDKDPKLQAELCKDPKAFAAKHDVTLTDEEVQQLKRLGGLMRLVGEFTAGRVYGPGPIYYPIDVWWKRTLLNHLIGYRPLFNPLFEINKYIPIYGYPAVTERRLAATMNVLRTRE